MTPEQIFGTAWTTGFPQDVAVVMTAIALAESGGDPGKLNAKDPDLSYGLWQINMIDKPGYLLGTQRRAQFGIASNDALYDPATNARAAYLIWSGPNGLGNWSTYNNGMYQQFLPVAQQAQASVISLGNQDGIGAGDGGGVVQYPDPVTNLGLGVGVGLVLLVLVILLGRGRD